MIHEIVSLITRDFNLIPEKISNYIRSILSDVSILDGNKDSKLIEGRINQSLLHPNSISLTLSNSWKREIPNRTEEGLIDTSLPPKYEVGKFTEASDIMDPRRRINPWEATHYTSHEHYILNPKQCIVINSKELINIPNGFNALITPLLSLSSTGMQVSCETLIQPCYRDIVPFNIFNASSYPTILYSGMEVARISFIKSQYSKICGR